MMNGKGKLYDENGNVAYDDEWENGLPVGEC
jgi:antitoxin component YwqK of YwqJK toxin-antitoxin module